MVVFTVVHTCIEHICVQQRSYTMSQRIAVTPENLTFWTHIVVIMLYDVTMPPIIHQQFRVSHMAHCIHIPLHMRKPHNIPHASLYKYIITHKEKHIPSSTPTNVPHYNNYTTIVYEHAKLAYSTMELRMPKKLFLMWILHNQGKCYDITNLHILLSPFNMIFQLSLCIYCNPTVIPLSMELCSHQCHDRAEI